MPGKERWSLARARVMGSASKERGKHATPELAYVVEIERGEAKIGGREEMTPWVLRVTMIFRPEDGEWNIVHRHADPINTAQAAESLIQQ
jgi:ketosteroid isomerase-like protein